MKKTVAVFVALILLLLSGCNSLGDDISSSFSPIYNSNVETIIDQIESEIAEQLQHGEITVSRETEISVYDDEDDVPPPYSSDSGTNTVIIDGAIEPNDVEQVAEAEVNTMGEKPLYYTYLTDSQQHIYRVMLTAAEQMTVGLFSIGAVSNQQQRFTDVAVTYRAFTSDNPQYFWMPDAYIISADGSMLAFSYKEKGADYTFTPEQRQTAQQQLDSVVNGICNEANKLNSRFEKEVYFHNWLCENVTYQNNETSGVYTAYGALVNGLAVCEGYSRAMQLLCDRVGIPCTVIQGTSNGVGHMWNMIDPGDGWYHLDVTWDDDEKYKIIRHAYVNLTDAQINKDHQMYDAVINGKSYVSTDDFNINLYSCNLDSYNYFKRKNLVFTDDAYAAAALILSADGNGQKNIEVLYEGTGDKEQFLNSLNQLLFNSGSLIWITSYSFLGDSITLKW